MLRGCMLAALDAFRSLHCAEHQLALCKPHWNLLSIDPLLPSGKVPYITASLHSAEAPPGICFRFIPFLPGGKLPYTTV
jgi:hypothetical protein